MDERPEIRNEEHGPRAGAARSWYEVLELSRDASTEEIEAAYDRAISLIEGRSIAGYLMLDPEAMESARHDVETAFLVLSDPDARAAFDAELACRERERGPCGDASEDAAPSGERDTELPARGSSDASSTKETEIPVAALGDASSTEATGLPKAGSAAAPDAADAAEHDTEIPREASEEGEAPEHDTELPQGVTGEGEAPDRDSSTPSRRRLSLRILAPVETLPETPAEALSAPPREAPRAPPRGPRDGIEERPPSVVEEPPGAPAAEERLRASDVAEARGPRVRFSSRAEIEEVSDPRPVREVVPPEEPQDNQLPADGEINGQVLRRVREARGISIAELAEATKIGKRYLIAMEEQNLDDLPARVYLRGFLTQVARVLKVDRTRLAEGYLAFVERYRRK